MEQTFQVGGRHQVVLSTAYFPPVQWFTKLLDGRVFVEACEHFTKQTYRNRCVIDSPQGPLSLTVPIVHDDADCCISELRLSQHGNWRHRHWQAFTSSYQNTPYFEFYADDFQSFFTEPYERLYDLNEDIVRKCCELIGLETDILRTTNYEKQMANDLRELISPKQSLANDVQFRPVPYYQMFSQQHGFLPNLSIADLLFNMGPESLAVLHQCRRNG